MCSAILHPVFVYGSLMRGLHNHHYLDRARFVCGGYVRGRLWDLGHYPALELADCSGLVAGEVYEIDEAIQHDLDSLEGYNAKTRKGCYLRQTQTVVTDAGAKLLADVYVGNMDLSRLQQIETGPITEYLVWRIQNS
jgi:gamma-glutamylcyclotransferase (GGCT)/AIG2-like uncharacterized protein YtfP